MIDEIKAELEFYRRQPEMALVWAAYLLSFLRYIYLP